MVKMRFFLNHRLYGVFFGFAGLEVGMFGFRRADGVKASLCLFRVQYI